MPELQPCPFCGKDAQIAPDEIGSGGQHVPPYHAGCLRGAGCGIAFTADDPDEAIAEWNRRALSTVTPAKVGGMVDAQTEARAIARCVRGCATDDQYIELVEKIATALAAKDAELADAKAQLQRQFDQTVRFQGYLVEAKAQLAEANKARNYLKDAVTVGLSDSEISRRAKLFIAASEAQGGER